MQALNDRSPPATFKNTRPQQEFHLSQIVEPVEKPIFVENRISSDDDLIGQLARVSPPEQVT
jgi:hypothetical protein